jgi:UPF0271 protein
MKLNADLGENEPPARTRALMELIDFANIACGGHAGTPATMEFCVKLALEHGDAIGAHPGLAADFGRGVAKLSPGELETLIVEQMDSLMLVAARHGAVLHHIKLHGALYHATEHSHELALHYVETVRRKFPEQKIVALADGNVIALCRELGVEALSEAFAERGYRADGSLIPRGEPGDLITNPREVAARIPSLRGDTICVHSDTPNAVEIARAAREVLGPRS